MIGKKGPFVHVSSMIANLLSKVRPFHLIREVRFPPPQPPKRGDSFI